MTRLWAVESRNRGSIYTAQELFYTSIAPKFLFGQSCHLAVDTQKLGWQGQKTDDLH
jgi:hypothetical protein